MTPREILAHIREKEVRAIDLRFMDFPGLWKHFTIPASALKESTFEEGLGFDGSSMRGWQSVNESDMVVVPVAETAFLDPFTRDKTLTMICNIQEPITRQDYTRDPRNVARKAANYLNSSGICDTAYFGPKIEFFVFDDIRFHQDEHSGFYFIQSSEGAWNTGREENPNLGHKIRYKEGYLPCAPVDACHDLRSEMMLTMLDCGIEVESHHHEGSTGGQGALDIRFSTLVEMADSVLKYKYIVKNVAKKHNKTATFMPKPIFQDHGSGMHVHCSLWKAGKNLFAGGGYAGLSDTAMYAIGGLLKHAPSLCAITNPTTNSYKRLVPDYDAPTKPAYSSRNRSATIRIPVHSHKTNSKRIEYRIPDSSSNPYLAFAGMVMAMIDGIKNKIHPGEPMDRNIYDLGPDERTKLQSTPLSLEESLKNLEQDHEYLLQGDVFTEDVIRTWVEYKRANEVEAVRMRPHPYEFALYYDL
ncbi:MAG: type I glutamate--ammonia ligase [Gemmataceae bacterium]